MSRRQSAPSRFSDHFGLNKSQAELDFVDVPLHTDIPLFIDPYALSIEPDPWFVECNDLVVGFFELVFDAIRDGRRTEARTLLRSLHENNDTHLGYSSCKTEGAWRGARAGGSPLRPAQGEPRGRDGAPHGTRRLRARHRGDQRRQDLGHHHEHHPQQARRVHRGAMPAPRHSHASGVVRALLGR